MNASLPNQFRNLCVGMKNRTSRKAMEISWLGSAVLTTPADMVAGVGIYAPDNAIYIRNFSAVNLPSTQVSADISAGLGQGGVDQAGTPAPHTWHGLYIASNNTQSGTYCVWSDRFESPRLDNLPGSPTHSCLIASNRTDATGLAFEHQILKVNRRAYYVGGDASSPGSYPLVKTGTGSKWTDLSMDGVVPPTGGPVGLAIRSTSYSGGLVAMAPNRWWSDAQCPYINNNASLADQSIMAEMLSDVGNAYAYWSTIAGAKIYATYFDDPQ